MLHLELSTAQINDETEYIINAKLLFLWPNHLKYD